MKYEMENGFWDLLLEAEVCREAAKTILDSDHDLTDVKRTRAEQYVRKSLLLGNEAWKMFFDKYTEATSKYEYSADFYAKYVTKKP